MRFDVAEAVLDYGCLFGFALVVVVTPIFNKEYTFQKIKAI
jgi:hypothetical protein